MREKGVGRNVEEIRVWMLRNHTRQTDIAERAQVSSALVNRTLKGKEDNMRVLHAMVSLGFPREILGIPDHRQS